MCYARLLILAGLCSASGLAQVQSGSTGNDGLVSPQQNLQAFQTKDQAFVASQPLFAAHNFPAAEAALEAPNIQKPDTPEWHVESGISLTKMAFGFSTQGDPATAAAVAQLALAHFSQADQTFLSTANPIVVAQEKELAGYVYQTLLNDRSDAKACYQAAVALSPNTGQAPALLNQILNEDAAAAAKVDSTSANQSEP